jgi:hypothetical protein
MNPLNLIRTNTTRFILAMLFNDDVTYTDILKNNFIDSYISDFYRPEYNGYLLTVNSVNKELSGTVSSAIKSYKNDTDYVFVYEIPEKYRDDYNVIRKGQYGRISDEYKLKLLKFWECDDETKLEENFTFGNLLYNDDRLKRVYVYIPFDEMYKIREQ